MFSRRLLGYVFRTIHIHKRLGPLPTRSERMKFLNSPHIISNDCDIVLEQYTKWLRKLTLNYTGFRNTTRKMKVHLIWREYFGKTPVSWFCC